jgi:DNA-binding MarR family transcriptional regulator
MSPRADAAIGNLTPTEELILDTLAARLRTGEHLWTFTSTLAARMRRLEAAGLVTSMGGVTENTIRASLTAAGRDAWLSSSWVPPLDTAERSDIARLLHDRCGELANQLTAAEATQDALAAINDQFRDVLAQIDQLVSTDECRASSSAVRALIARVKESL